MRVKKPPKGCSRVKSLSPSEIEELRSKLTPPLTKEQIMEKRCSEANKPDMSHLTPWAP